MDALGPEETGDQRFVVALYLILSSVSKWQADVKARALSKSGWTTNSRVGLVACPKAVKFIVVHRDSGVGFVSAAWR